MPVTGIIQMVIKRKMHFLNPVSCLNSKLLKLLHCYQRMQILPELMLPLCMVGHTMTSIKLWTIRVQLWPSSRTQLVTFSEGTPIWIGKQKAANKSEMATPGNSSSRMKKLLRFLPLEQVLQKSTLEMTCSPPSTMVSGSTPTAMKILIATQCLLEEITSILKTPIPSGPLLLPSQASMIQPGPNSLVLTSRPGSSIEQYLDVYP